MTETETLIAEARQLRAESRPVARRAHGGAHPARLDEHAFERPVHQPVHPVQGAHVGCDLLTDQLPADLLPVLLHAHAVAQARHLHHADLLDLCQPWRPTTAPCQRPRQRSGSHSRRRSHLSRRSRYEAVQASGRCRSPRLTLDQGRPAFAASFLAGPRILASGRWPSTVPRQQSFEKRQPELDPPGWRVARRCPRLGTGQESLQDRTAGRGLSMRPARASARSSACGQP
jgi:hypothetical protein